MATREAKAKKVVFVSGESEGKQRMPNEGNVERIEFQFANGNTHTVVATDLPENVQRCALWHGISQKLGDEYSGAKTADEAEEAFLALLERLTDGDWATERAEAGPRTSLIFEAICIAYERAGKPLTDEQKTEKREALKDAATRKAAQEHPAIAAVYLELQAQRAVEKANKAREALANSGLEL